MKKSVYLIVGSILFCVALLLVSLFAKEKIFVEEFSVDQRYHIEGEKVELTFTATLSQPVDELVLCRNGSPCGTMQDDGTNGDADSNDGQYSCKITICHEGEGTEQFSIEAEKIKGQQIEVWFFERPDEEQAAVMFDQIDQINQEIENKTRSYTTEEGVPLEMVPDAIRAVSKYIEELYHAGIVLEYYVGDSYVEYRLNSGIPCVYTPHMGETTKEDRLEKEE